LPDGVGIPVRKVSAVLRALTGVRLTQGALTQDALPHVEGSLGTAYAGWRALMPEAPVVHTDAPGGRVGGEPADRMGFETDGATVYHIRPRHRHAEVQEVIPADDAGVMVTDRGRSYEAQAFDSLPQQQCLAHSQRSISAVLETTVGRARDVGEPRKGLLQEALELWHACRDGQRTDDKVDAEALQEEITYQLRHRSRQDPDPQRRLNELDWPHDRGNLVRFLADLRGEPTNNRAERALRPAVIARKVSQCSKNDRGAGAFAVFTSIIRTLMNTDTPSVVETLSQLLHPTQLPYAST
jgi:hypothetical protein